MNDLDKPKEKNEKNENNEYVDSIAAKKAQLEMKILEANKQAKAAKAAAEAKVAKANLRGQIGQKNKKPPVNSAEEGVSSSGIVGGEDKKDKSDKAVEKTVTQKIVEWAMGVPMVGGFVAFVAGKFGFSVEGLKGGISTLTGIIEKSTDEKPWYSNFSVFGKLSDMWTKLRKGVETPKSVTLEKESKKEVYNGLNIGEVLTPLKNIIASGESRTGKNPYNAINNKTSGDAMNVNLNLEKMTVGKVLQMQKDEKINAAGKYQLVRTTLLAGVKEMGIALDEPYNANTQERLFIYLIKYKRPKVWGYLTMASDDLEGAMYELSSEFGSIPKNVLGGGVLDGINGNRVVGGSQKYKKVVSVLKNLRANFAIAGGNEQANVIVADSIGSGIVAQAQKMVASKDKADGQNRKIIKGHLSADALSGKIKTSCWDWAWEVYERQGLERSKVFWNKKNGDMKDVKYFGYLSSIKAGDTLIIHNGNSYGNGTHSVIFDSWVGGKVGGEINAYSYGGGKTPPRKSVYSASKGQIRAVFKPKAV